MTIYTFTIDKDLHWRSRDVRRRSRENAYDTSPSLNSGRKGPGKQVHMKNKSPLAVNNSNLVRMNHN